MGDDLGDLQHVVAAHARRQQGLVGIAQRRVGEQGLRLGQGPVGEALGAELAQQVPGAAGDGLAVVVGGHRRRGEDRIGLEALGRGVAVDDHVAQVGQELARAVAPRLEVEQRRRGVDEARGGLARAEGLVVDDVVEERDVGLDAADAELVQGPLHALEGVLPGRRAHRELDQQGVVVGRDHRAVGGDGGVEADAAARRGAIGEDAPDVRREAVLRVLGGDAALERKAVARDGVLGRYADVRIVQPAPGGDEDLRAHQVDVGNLLGDRVLHLDARVHLDEEPVTRLGVHQEFHGSGVLVADLPGQAHGGVAQGMAHGVGQVHRGGDLDHLLVAPLDRAVALVQVHHVALLVGEDLHLDVLGVLDEALEEDGAVAEGVLRLRARLIEQPVQLLGRAHHAHAAPAAAVGGLDDQREADTPRHLHGGVAVLDGLLGARQGGHLRPLREFPGRGLVAHLGQQLGARTDEGDAVVGTGAGELRILRQEPVAGMDGVHPLVERDVDDALDVQVGPDRALVRIELIGLVGLRAMDGQAIFLRIDGNGPDAELVGGAKDTNGDLAAVGNQQLFEGLDRHGAPR